MLLGKVHDPCLAKCQWQAVASHPSVKSSHGHSQPNFCRLNVPRVNELGNFVDIANEAEPHGNFVPQEVVI